MGNGRPDLEGAWKISLIIILLATVSTKTIQAARRYCLNLLEGLHTAIEHILVPLGCRVYRVVYLLSGKTLRARLVHRSHDTFQI